VDALARHRSNCMSKLQTHPLVREGGPQQETCNCETENKKDRLAYFKTVRYTKSVLQVAVNKVVYLLKVKKY
jgi:hypothetical protein